MYRGRVSIEEAMKLPNRVLLALAKIRSDELSKEANQQSEAGQLMEEEMQEGGIRL